MEKIETRVVDANQAVCQSPATKNNQPATLINGIRKKLITNHLPLTIKKPILFLIFLITGYFAMAQDQTMCKNNHITPSFDSECILTNYDRKEPGVIIDESDCNHVCKNSTVTYNISVPTGSSIIWTVLGANSFSVTQVGTISVNWGNSDEGFVSATITETNGNVYIETLCVVLIDPPDISSTSFPAGTAAGDIIICLGQNVIFTNSTTVSSGESPIVANLWITTQVQGSFSETQTSENYTFTPIDKGDYTVTHRVINSCGCESSETYTVHVNDSDIKFEISCYGTVCHGTTHSYTLIEPTNCNNYNWTATNGNINGSTTSQTVTVTWGNPQDGYGILTLNGCGSTECANGYSIIIPIIPSNSQIFGPDTVCVGETQIYSTTLWGSTEYTWDVKYNGNIDYPQYHETQNQIIYLFEQPGMYLITLIYDNKFLNCGDTTYKTVTVLPILEINTENSIVCAGDTVNFTTNAINTSATPTTWHIYDSSNQLIAASQGMNFTYIFTTAGKYKITAKDTTTCNTASYMITVKDPPPAYNGIISGPHIVCPSSTVSYSATAPTNPNYVLTWQLMPPCANDFYSGNDVSITFANSVCDIMLFQKDIVSGCLSDSTLYTVHSPIHTAIDSSVNVCAGGLVHLWVPDQSPTVQYEWSINPTNAASIEGSNLGADVTIVANQTNYSSAYAVIKQNFCGTIQKDSIKLNIKATAPILNHDFDVCVNEAAKFIASGPVGNYTWIFDDGSANLSGNSVQHSFSTSGQHFFELIYTPIGCPPDTIQGSIFVNVLPDATVTPHTIGSTIYMTVSQMINTTYQWFFNDVPIPGATDSVINTENQVGIYCCEVTDSITQCINKGCFSIVSPEPECLQMNLTVNMIDCNKYEVTAHQPIPLNLMWSVIPSAGTTLELGNPQTTVTVTFNAAGFFNVRVDGTNSDTCYVGIIEIPVDVVPNLDFQFLCPNVLNVIDISSYRADFSIPQRTINVSCGTQSQNISGTQNIATFNLPPVNTPTQCTVSMTIAGSICTVTQNFTYYPLPSNLSITTDNVSCENTAILFTASANNASSYEWNFGDGSFSNNNPVYHTYDPGSYTVTLTAYNENGCSASITQSITISANNITGALHIDGNQVCMGQQRPISWSPSDTDYTYQWSPTLTPSSSNTYSVYESGDYFVTVTNSIGCTKTANINVPFYNNPTAIIIGKTCYCQDDIVDLSAYTAADITDYKWTINGLQYSQTANLTFTAIQAGNYTVILTVTNGQNCFDKDTVIIQVLQKPNPPNLMITGNNCIHQPPVCVTTGTGTTGISVHWSNGSFGNTACFYNSGFVTAYYTAPNGCSSNDAKLMICPAPNFDALLTGCFDTCVVNIDDFQLNTYMLMPYYSENCGSPNYQWALNGQPYNTSNPPNLNINQSGSYTLTVNYANGCTVTSNPLIINIKSPEECGEPPIPPIPCDSATVEGCYVDCCKIYFDKMLRVCNKTNKPVKYTHLTGSAGYTVVSWYPNPLYLEPGQCANIWITITVDDITQTTGYFTLSTTADENCGLDPPCDLVFSITPNLDCIQNIKLCDFTSYSLTYNAAASTPLQNYYFDFNLVLPPGTQNLISLWTTPTVVINYNYLPPNIVTGNIIITHAQLMDIIAAGGEICFYAIVCRLDADGKYIFCKAKICFPIPVPPPCTDVVIEDCYLICGQLYSEKQQRICNKSNNTITYTNLTSTTPGFTVTSWYPNPLILQPGECKNIKITIKIDNPNLTIGQFTLSSYVDDNCSNPCDLTFPLTFDCIQSSEDCSLNNFNFLFNANLSTPQQLYYFDITTNFLPITATLMNFVVTPNFFQNYNYTPPNIITGRIRITRNELLEMMEGGKDFCFEAMISYGDKTCNAKICIHAADFYNKVPESFK